MSVGPSFNSFYLGNSWIDAAMQYCSETASLSLCLCGQWIIYIGGTIIQQLLSGKLVARRGNAIILLSG
jgi:hypothetical protein